MTATNLPGAGQRRADAGARAVNRTIWLMSQRDMDDVLTILSASSTIIIQQR